MLDRRRWLRNAAGCTAWFAGTAWVGRALAGNEGDVGPGASPAARRLLDWVRRTGDAKGRPFAVVDKRAAHIHVFHADGRLAGHSPALLGSTFGDHTVPGVGARAQTGSVGVDERTTPAGRFDAQPGRNDKGEHVVWVDYASAFAIHRLRPGFAYQARSVRLATDSPDARRVSWGCVVVPVAFYAQVIERVLGASRSVVYVLPEAGPMHAVFGAIDGV